MYRPLHWNKYRLICISQNFNNKQNTQMEVRVHYTQVHYTVWYIISLCYVMYTAYSEHGSVTDWYREVRDE